MINFGPSGNSLSFYAMGYKHTVDAPEYLDKFALDCYEYSFGRGVNISEETATSIGNAFEKGGKEISVHAPYYINFANPTEEAAQKSYDYVISSARALKCFGGKRLVFHPAAQGKAERGQAVALTCERLKVLRDKIYQSGLQDLYFCPETMGKLAQIGTLEEVVEFCKIDKIYLPCIDFGHINAREQGSLQTVADYRLRLEYMIDELGYDRVKHFHVHFSKIMYSAKGEVKHLTFADKVFGPEFHPLAVALKELKLEPYIVSESDGTQAEDASKMKEIYNSIDI